MRVGRSLIAGLVFLVSNASLNQAAAGEDRAISVSINAKNQMSIPIIINGEPTFGIVDTGATFPLVDVDLLPVESLRQQRPSIVVQGLSGTTDYDVTTVASIEIGNDRMEAVEAGINDRSRFPGLLNVIPADAFKERVIDFDFQEGLISLYDGQPINDRREFRSRISYQEINRLPFIPVRINNTTGMALIDTGSNSTFVNSAFADTADVKERHDLAKTLVGVDTDATPARVVQLQRLRIGRHRINNYNVLVADPELFETLGFGERPVMIIGLDVWRHFRLQIDRRNNHVWVTR